MPQEIVSVIIPVYNEKNDMQMCLDTIFNQTYPNLQVFFVYSKKADPQVKEQLSRYSEKAAVEEIVDLGNLSDIIDKTTGDYITIIPSGDWMSLEYIEKLCEIMRSESCDVVRSAYYSMREKDMVRVNPHMEEVATQGLRLFTELYSAKIKSTITKRTDCSNLKVCENNSPMYFHMEKWEDKDTFISRMKSHISWGMDRLQELTIIPAKHKHSKKIKGLKGKFAGERCFIIGTGPSLRMSDLDLLKNEHTFGVNRIDKAFGETEWRPTFYAVSDFKLLADYRDEIDKIEAKYKFFPVELKRRLKSITDSTYLFYNKSAFYGGRSANFSMDSSECVYSGGTVMYTCIQLAVYLGFSEIYFLGIDNTFKIAKTRDGFKFDDSGKHFTSNYFPEGQAINYARPDIIDDAFEYAKLIGERTNVKMYNATRGGRLNMFERVDLDKLIGNGDQNKD